MWAMLWVLVSVIESAAYLHDPSVPFWQPLALISILACTVAAWLTFELRSVRYLAVPLDPPRPWFVRQLRRLPMLACGYVVAVIGLRQAVFAIAGAHYWHVPWPILIPFELVKASLFYCLWLGLVFGTLSQIRSREQAVQLGLIQKALVEAQLARLRAQLRPHFLFNALNTVSSLMQDDVQRADRLLTRLGDLLRASLNAGESDTVPLHEEIRLLRCAPVRDVLLNGVSAVAAPVFDADDRLCAVMTALGTSGSFDPTPGGSTALVVRQAADAVSARLGHRPRA